MIVFTVPIYGGEVHVHLNSEEYAADKEALGGMDDEDDVNDFFGLQEKVYSEDKEKRYYLVGVFNNSLYTLIHELTHLAVGIAVDTRWEINDQTDEPFSYLLEHLFKEVYPHVKDRLT
jgi:hypothetical protein